VWTWPEEERKRGRGEEWKRGRGGGGLLPTPDLLMCVTLDGHLACRRAAETNGSRLWRVHDKMYDFEKYLSIHPGGRQWLERLRGCDTTEVSFL
jgi:hypothetical protein